MSSFSHLLPNKTKVLIHSFGHDGKTHTGTIKGIAFDHITKIYIVEMDPNNPWDHPYDSITVPEGCLLKYPFEHEECTINNCRACKIIQTANWKVYPLKDFSADQ
jgi:hypothetical protein